MNDPCCSASTWEPPTSRPWSRTRTARRWLKRHGPFPLPVGDGGMEQDIEEIWAAARGVIATSPRGGAEPDSRGGRVKPGRRTATAQRRRPARRTCRQLARPACPGLRCRAYPGTRTRLVPVPHRPRPKRPCARPVAASPTSVSGKPVAPRRVGFVGTSSCRACAVGRHTTARPAGSRSCTTPPSALTTRMSSRSWASRPNNCPTCCRRARPPAVCCRRRQQTGLTAASGLGGHPRPIRRRVGTGAVEPGTVMVGAGTAWVLLAVSDRLAPPVIDEAFVCTHVVDGLFGQILSLVNAGRR